MCLHIVSNIVVSNSDGNKLAVSNKNNLNTGFQLPGVNNTLWIRIGGT